MTSLKTRRAPGSLFSLPICHGLSAKWFALVVVSLAINPLLADDAATPSQEPAKPAAADTKPTASGVSISLKLLPSNQSAAKSPSGNSDGTATSANKQADPKPAKKVDAKESKESVEGKTLAVTKTESKTDKKETGTVELKLLPPKPVDEKLKEVKPAGTVEVSLQPAKTSDEKLKQDKPTGTVEVTLQAPKEKTLPPGNGKVSIELSQPAARRTITDGAGTTESGPLVIELKKTPSESTKTTSGGASDSSPIDTEDSSDETTEESSESVDESAIRIPNKSRGGDPGDPGDGEAEPLPAQPGDVPLIQESQPFDAPAAKATKGDSRFHSSSLSTPLISESELERGRRIEDVLEYFRTHPENVVRRGPWALMHAILPYGVDTEVIAGKRKVNAIGWLCHNGISAKQRMFQPTQSGFRTNVGPGVQGHEGQFLAILAQSHVQSDYPIQIGNKKYTIRDLVKYEMATCREKTELTFKLIGFTHYLEPQQTWRDNRGRPWSIEKLVAEELAQPINGEACGGTHRLMGLTCAVVNRQEAGLPINGHFERAEKFLNDFVEYTLTLQNADGSFSTEWFERRAEESNVERKVQTTGHTLEWLIYTLPDEHLRSPEIVKAVDFLLNTIGKNPSRDWPIGPRGHSLRALTLYHKRVYKDQETASPVNVATQPTGKAVQR